MLSPRLLSCIVFLLSLTPVLYAQDQQPPPGVLTLKSTSTLVFLDVTVLDKKGHPVVKGLTKDDFTITDEKTPQRIFSFEPPEAHLVTGEPDKVPETIFVLDLLNSNFEDFAYIRYTVRKYLASQPGQLSSPSELMVLGNKSLEVLQGYTRSKSDLLYALDHLPPALPYKMMSGSFFFERFGESLDALQQVALQSRGVSGRKNIIWVGHGGPNLNTQYLDGSDVQKINRYVHDTTNLLVDARLSLFVIYPGLSVQGPDMSISAMSANADIGEADPFAGDINFGVLVNATGGKLFYNRNDIDVEMKTSQQYGSNYYTLTYQPPDAKPNGKFRRIRVTLNDPNLRVVTKAGYYAPDINAPVDARKQLLQSIAEAAQATIPFSSLDVSIEHITRHPDNNTAEISVLLKSRNMTWQSRDDGKSTTNFYVAAVSLDGSRTILASKLESLTAIASTQTPERLAAQVTPIHITVRVPRKTHDLRVVVQTSDTRRVGTVEFDRKRLEASPEAPTPEPQLLTPQTPAKPATP